MKLSLFLKYIHSVLEQLTIQELSIPKEMMLSSNIMIWRACLLPISEKIIGKETLANEKNIFVSDGNSRMLTLTRKGSLLNTNPLQAQALRSIFRKEFGVCIRKRKKYQDSIFKKGKKKQKKHANTVFLLSQ